MDVNIESGKVGELNGKVFEKVLKTAQIVMGDFYDQKFTEEELDAKVLGIISLLGIELSSDEIERCKKEIKLYLHRNVFITNQTGTFSVASNRVSRAWWDLEEMVRFQAFLQTLMHLPTRVIETLELDTDKIVSFLENPTVEEGFEIRALVLGVVQSGKSISQFAVANKCLDGGYDIVIFCSGNTEMLRLQYQKRVDHHVVGKNTNTGETIGIGLYMDRAKRAVPVTTRVTTILIDGVEKKVSDGDIRLETLTHVKYEPGQKYVFVVKKIKNSMKLVKDWLKNQNFELDDKGRIKDLALLLIDDECDASSPNISRDKSSTINGLILDVLNIFDKNVYLGYTATPFANILSSIYSQDKLTWDIFPKDFIYLLRPPSNYLGPTEFFKYPWNVGENPTPFVKLVSDNLDSITIKGGAPRRLPSSLKEAIINYIVAGAVKQLRGVSKSHHSMLIHTNVYTDTHGYLNNLVEEYLEHIRLVISGEIEDDFVYSKIGAIYTDILDKSVEIATGNTNKYDLDFTLSEVVEAVNSYLFETDSKNEARIKVMSVNSANENVLNYDEYDEGLHVIAIGGYLLSRGYTLEGLVISYYARKSVTMDTIIQACRWYGYHDEYKDLIRVYTTNEIHMNLCICTEVLNKLIEHFSYISSREISPLDYQVRIDKLKGELSPTRANAMRNARTKKTNEFIGEAIDYATFVLDDEEQTKYLNYTVELINDIGIENFDGGKDYGSFFCRDVDPEQVVTFLNKFPWGNCSRIKQPEHLFETIENIIAKEELVGIDVVLVSNKAKLTKIYTMFNDLEIAMSKRKDAEYNHVSNTFVVGRGKISTPRHFGYGLTEEEHEELLLRTGKSFKDNKVPSLNQMMSIRSKRKAGLLLIYLLDPNSLNEKLSDFGEGVNVPYVGLSLVLPGESERAIFNKSYEQLDEFITLLSERN